MTSSIIHVGDCLDVMRSTPDASIDSIVTDPPYGLGFMGREWDRALPDPRVWLEALRVSKPGAHGVIFGHPKLYHRLACQVEDAGWEIRDCGMWLYGSGFPKSHNIDDEHGTALKPAWEPWLLVRAPFRGTVEECFRENGTGVLNIAACRIDATDARPLMMPRDGTIGAFADGGLSGSRVRSGEDDPRGRWPANLILDEHAARALDEQTGVLRSGSARAGTPRGVNEIYGPLGGVFEHDIVASSGGASRFFYCAKLSRSEREAGLEDFIARVVTDGRETVNDTAYLRDKTERKNVHPTVKPIELMRYLVRLVTPAGGLVMDPFSGSGTTGCAAALEGRRFVGAELDEWYARIARARIAHWSGSGERVPPFVPATPAPSSQPSLFDGLEVA